MFLFFSNFILFRESNLILQFLPLSQFSSLYLICVIIKQSGSLLNPILNSILLLFSLYFFSHCWDLMAIVIIKYIKMNIVIRVGHIAGKICIQVKVKFKFPLLIGIKATITNIIIWSNVVVKLLGGELVNNSHKVLFPRKEIAAAWAKSQSKPRAEYSTACALLLFPSFFVERSGFNFVLYVRSSWILL